jgi:hypothetical protein
LLICWFVARLWIAPRLTSKRQGGAGGAVPAHARLARKGD